MHGSKDVVITQPIETVETFNEGTNTQSESTSVLSDKSTLFSIVGLGSYGILVVGFVGLVALFVFAKPSSKNTPSDSQTEIQVTSTSSTRKSLSSSSHQKSKPILSASDFQKMVQDVSYIYYYYFIIIILLLYIYYIYFVLIGG